MFWQSNKHLKFNIKSSSAKSPFRASIDSKLVSFSEHVINISATSNRKLHSLSCISKYISLKMLRILMKLFIISKFSYCTLIWITNCRGINDKINHIHERVLRIIYKGFSASFECLLLKDKSVTTNNPNLQQLAIEIFTVKLWISPVIMKEIFNFSDSNNNNLRSRTNVSRPFVHTTHYRTESTAYLAAKIWELVTENIKEANSLSSLKKG